MPEESPITNRWGEVPRRPVAAEHSCVFRGEGGRAYNHHPQVTSLDGRLLATWSNGPRDEDMVGQHMLLATSGDLGETWSPPRALAGPLPGRHGFGVLTAEGIHVHEGRMTAYFGYYDITDDGMLLYYACGGNMSLARGKRCHAGAYTGILASDDGGETWAGPVGRIERFIPNLAPHRLVSGRLILPGNFRYPWTDDPLGRGGWHMASLPRIPDDLDDEPEGHPLARRIRGDAHGHCEGSCFQTDDGVVHMMLRTGTGRLAVSESRDDGRSWSEPVLTGYTDCDCRFHFGRLPDGRFFGLSCPEPGSARTPLVLAAGDDGIVFDRHYVLGEEANFLARIPGVHKYGRYGYPQLHTLDAATGVAIYSVNKEDVYVCRFPLAALD